MAADHLQFLKDKFMDDFQEAAEEFEELPLRLHFQRIFEVLRRRTINPSTPIVLKDSLYRLRYVLTECVMLAEKEQERTAQDKNSRFSAHSMRKLWFLHKNGKKLRGIEAELQKTRDNVEEAESSPSNLSLITVHRSRSPFQPVFFRRKIYGFDEQLQKIEELLLKTSYSKSIEVVGIVGMGGVGKTALAHEVFCRVRSQFDYMFWIGLSEKLNPEDVDCRIQIIRQIIENFDDTTDIHASSDLDDLLRVLHNKLSGKRYLIVLDNVWHISDWYADLDSNSLQKTANITGNCCTHLSHGLPNEHRGAIIVTSRLKEVARHMVGQKNLLLLHPSLDAESCWSIFMDSMRQKHVRTGISQVLDKMKDEIIDVCDGLPIAALTLAEVISIRLMKDQFWSDRTILKWISLEVHACEDQSLYQVTLELGSLPGVERVTIERVIKTRGALNQSWHSSFPAYEYTVRVISYSDPEEIVKQIEKFCFTQLLSVLYFCSPYHLVDEFDLIERDTTTQLRIEEAEEYWRDICRDRWLWTSHKMICLLSSNTIQYNSNY